MRSFLNRYETEIRIGLVAIVLLLILLNISTTYILHRVKMQLTEHVDDHLTSALHLASLYLIKSGETTIPQDQLSLIRQRTDIAEIDVIPLDLLADSGGDQGQPQVERILKRLPPISKSSLESLKSGEQLYCFSRSDGRRLALTMVKCGYDKRLVIIAGEDSWVLNAISSAAEKTLYLALIVVLLLVPLTVFLPRFILKPFKTMHEAARTAGRLEERRDGDEVAEVIQSYENIIRELRNSEAELRLLYRASSNKADRLEEFNRYVLMSINSGVITVDLSGKVVRYNRAAGDILGYAEEEVIDSHYLTAFSGADKLGLMIEAGLTRGETVSHREVELVREDNSRLWLGVESSLIYDDNRRPVGITLLLTDMTEIRQLESELEIKRRMAALGEMTAGLAHQLRNSLAAVSGFCRLMKKKAGQRSELADIAESVRAETAASETMVRRFLDFARPLRLNTERIDPGAMLRECLAKFMPGAEGLAIDLRLDCKKAGISVMGDALLLKEAICNLVDNAIHAAGRGGFVKIELDKYEGVPVITISDSGPGIADNIRDRIFTPFFSSKPSGTGLGLALAQKIIHLHKGRIFFEPGHGQGAVCRVMLPDGLGADVPGHGLLSSAVKKG